jgi:hypothetical protein|tara:strand:- start:10096 stop:10563 length:468 start_codon:yes stop_codon:yes gene_type:complete
MAFEPEAPDRYIGKQLIFNSNGRILLNAEEDQTLWSNKGFLFSTNGEFHFNTSTQKDSKFVVNSPKIQLGIDPGSTTTVNPAVKGNELEKILNEILDIIDNMYKIDLMLLNPIAPIAGPCAPDAAFKSKTQAAQGRITSLKQRLKEIKSEKVFLT